MQKTAFVGRKHSGTPRLPFDHILENHVLLRDCVANKIHGEIQLAPEQWPFIATSTFTYVFNAYKALGILLPGLYHESASVILRQLWEASLNLHWIELDKDTRSQDFLNFTVIEFRKIMQKVGGSPAVKDFDAVSATFQSKFKFKDKKGKERRYDTFSGATVQERADKLGEPWKSDYSQLYNLTSMHAHGAPGAILHSHFVQHSGAPAIKEQDSTALVAYISMRVLLADFNLLVRNGIVAASAEVNGIFDRTLELTESKEKENQA